MQYNVTIKNIEKSRIEITGEIPASDFETFEAKALERLGQNVELPGFRKGHVPADVLKSRLGDMAILEEMAELALSGAYPKIIDENKVFAIGRPEISLTKIARGNPLGFTIKTAILPTFTLPDYKKFAQENNKEKISVTVTDEDVEKALLEIRRMRAHQELHEKEGDHDHHDHGDALSDDKLPPLDEAYVKTLGNFDSIDALKAKLRENIALEKEQEEKSKRRVSLFDKLISKTEIDLPDVLVEAELEKLFSRMKHDIERAGLSMEDYLKHLGKTETTIREDWTPDATKRAKMELIIDAIAKAENIKPDEKRAEEDTAYLIGQYKDADPLSTRLYVEHVLTNEKVIEFLENQ